MADPGPMHTRLGRELRWRRPTGMCTRGASAAGLERAAISRARSAARRAGERRQQLARSHPQLRCHDRLVGLHDDRVRAPGARAGMTPTAGGHALGDERLPGRVARASRSSSSSPSARAASGSRSPIRSGRRPARLGSLGVHARRRATEPRRCRRRRHPPPSGVPIERSAGSRSSSVVVVTNAWGSAAIRRTRCARRSGSSSENTSSRSSSGGRPSSAVSRSSSASLNARIAVRCWPRDANVASVRPSSSNATSSRCGPTSVEPFQTSFSAVSARRRLEGITRRLAGVPRARWST